MFVLYYAVFVMEDDTYVVEDTMSEFSGIPQSEWDAVIANDVEKMEDLQIVAEQSAIHEDEARAKYNHAKNELEFKFPGMKGQSYDTMQAQVKAAHAKDYRHIYATVREQQDLKTMKDVAEAIAKIKDDIIATQADVKMLQGDMSVVANMAENASSMGKSLWSWMRRCQERGAIAPRAIWDRVTQRWI